MHRNYGPTKLRLRAPAASTSRDNAPTNDYLSNANDSDPATPAAAAASAAATTTATVRDNNFGGCHLHIPATAPSAATVNVKS